MIEHPQKPFWENMGCLIGVIAFGIFLLIVFHGDAIARKLVGDC